MIGLLILATQFVREARAPKPGRRIARATRNIPDSRVRFSSRATRDEAPPIRKWLTR